MAEAAKLDQSLQATHSGGRSEIARLLEGTDNVRGKLHLSTIMTSISEGKGLAEMPYRTKPLEEALGQGVVPRITNAIREEIFNVKEVSPGIWRSGQPYEKGLGLLKEAGIKSVVAIRDNPAGSGRARGC